MTDLGDGPRKQPSMIGLVQRGLVASSPSSPVPMRSRATWRYRIQPRPANALWPIWWPTPCPCSRERFATTSTVVTLLSPARMQRVFGDDDGGQMRVGASSEQSWSELGATLFDLGSGKAGVDSSAEWGPEGRAFKSHRPDQLQPRSRFLCHNLPVAPDVDGCSVHASGFAGHPAGAAKRASYAENEIVSWFLSFSFHGLLSIKTGRSPELSYPPQESASKR
jgi:hypothetical protein